MRRVVRQKLAVFVQQKHAIVKTLLPSSELGQGAKEGGATRGLIRRAVVSRLAASMTASCIPLRMNEATLTELARAKASTPMSTLARMVCS